MVDGRMMDVKEEGGGRAGSWKLGVAIRYRSMTSLAQSGGRLDATG